ncbi:MAG: hypothetical protein Q8L60_05520 [Gammaproteobacteria bacterium]|nr:hypothetical protein [Gammaproteobacteria bacterium]MDP2140552.1 hypothetical protein [Gammaproteobacteria bacterium]MDP2347321.1 hypothetical protein [Gammaproteobacteria bacterium]
MLTLSRQLSAQLVTAVNPAHLRTFFLLFGALLISHCTTVETPYKAYAGEPRPASELALVMGDIYYRQDWLNSYVDAVRFFKVDGQEIENSRAWEQILLSPGMRELEVYYSWDMGARIGLAPALVSYASNRESISRTLRIHAEAGKTYSVKAEPVFNGDPSDIGSLAHVDFWVEDSEGRVVLSKEEGRFRPAQ